VLGLVLWVSPILGLVTASISSFFQRDGKYIELIITGIIADVVYGSLVPIFAFIQIPIFTLCSFIIFILLYLFNKQTSIYA